MFFCFIISTRRVEFSFKHGIQIKPEISCIVSTKNVTFQTKVLLFPPWNLVLSFTLLSFKQKYYLKWEHRVTEAKSLKSQFFVSTTNVLAEWALECSAEGTVRLQCSVRGSKGNATGAVDTDCAWSSNNSDLEGAYSLDECVARATCM